jgi:prevent-host-death family protein
MERIQRIKPYEAKRALTTVINRVSLRHEPIIFESRGKDLAVLISIEDFRILQQVKERLQDQIDREEAIRILNDPKEQDRIPWEDLKRELNP